MNTNNSDKKIERKKYSPQFKDQALERAVKEGGGVLCQGVKVKYALIKEQSNKFPVLVMCRLLTVSVSGYYSWLNRRPSLREQENKQLACKIKAIFDDEKQRPGAPRITK